MRARRRKDLVTVGRSKGELSRTSEAEPLTLTMSAGSGSLGGASSTEESASSSSSSSASFLKATLFLGLCVDGVPPRRPSWNWWDSWPLTLCSLTQLLTVLQQQQQGCG